MPAAQLPPGSAAPTGRSSPRISPRGRRSARTAALHQNRRYLRGVLTRHLFAVGSFCDYLDRFETD